MASEIEASDNEEDFDKVFDAVTRNAPRVPAIGSEENLERD